MRTRGFPFWRLNKLESPETGQPIRNYLKVSSAILGPLTIVLTTILGAGAFLYPFFTLGKQEQNEGQQLGHAGDAPLVFVLIMGLCLLCLSAELETHNWSTRQIALLGVLAALNAVMRFIPIPGGGPVFVLPIFCGYIFGGEFGFLLGAISLLVSALFTGGVGPWLPYQMLGLGWVGLSSGMLKVLGKILFLKGREGRHLLEKIVLIVWGLVWGMVYGAILNIWFWPFSAPNSGDSQTAYIPGSGLNSIFTHYATFYFITSFFYDAARAITIGLLIAVLATPTLRILRRYQQRFHYELAARIK